MFKRRNNKAGGDPAPANTPAKKQAAENPYLAAQRADNDKHMDLAKAKYNWQVMAMTSLGILVFSVVGNIWQGVQSKYVPYLVEVDKLGGTVVVGPADQRNPADVKRILYHELGRFIENARTVISDRDAQKTLIDRVYAYLPNQSAARVMLTDYYRTRDPFKLAETTTVGTEINNVLELSKNTYQVEWTEQTRSLRGEKTGLAIHWKAVLTVEIHPPTKEDQIRANPVGIYVMQINWSRQM